MGQDRSAIIRGMKRAETDEYYKVLCENYPDWLDDYLPMKRLQAEKYISMTCGTAYSDMSGIDTFYSNYDHTIAVALMVWHFTHDKKQALAGLFHDIATPAFKHCVDYLNGDYLTQESTEALTTFFIKKSKNTMSLLARDGIKVEEVDDCHRYSVLDNDTPKLSVDRLEYTLSGAMYSYGGLSFEDVKEIYEDIEVQRNEKGEPELGFKTKAIARKFVRLASKFSMMYRNGRNVYSLQFMADLLKRMCDDDLLSVKQLYELKESEVIEIIRSSKYASVFEKWARAKRVKTSKERPQGVYCVRQETKVRYIDPLCNGERMSKICKISKRAIDKCLAYHLDDYVYLDFDF